MIPRTAPRLGRRRLLLGLGRGLIAFALPLALITLVDRASLATPQAAKAAVTADDRGQKRVASGDRVQCTVRVILGEQKPGGVDKRLNLLRKQLSKPPFSAYKSLRLLEAKQLVIAPGALKQTKLPTGKLLTLRFKEKLLVKGKLRLRMHLSIMPPAPRGRSGPGAPKAKEFLPGTLFTIADGGTLLVAGDRHQGGTLVVGITCQAK